MIRRQESLDYHARERRGKLEIAVTKPILTQRDLMCAYMPGVTEPCHLIAENADRAYEYTAKQNLIAVITDGSAVLTLGDIGPLAAKPMMEGKSVLFKRFADIDAFDLELDTRDPEEFIWAVRLLEPTFGAICLEDIVSPKCFFIEEALRQQMRIPVFHDKQHGAATVVAAALINALEVQGKRAEDIRLVIAGTGPSGIGSANLLLELGVCVENVSRVFRLISQYLPIPTRPIPLFGADIIDETKETIKQAYIARTLTGRPIHLTMAIGYEVPDVEDEDYGSAIHREAEELFWALRPLKRIYQEAIRKHIIQAKLETEVIGRRLSPELILTFAPSYNGLVRRRLRAQWGKWINW